MGNGIRVVLYNDKGSEAPPRLGAAPDDSAGRASKNLGITYLVSQREGRVLVTTALPVLSPSGLLAIAVQSNNTG